MELDINTIKNEIKKINELYEPQGFKIVSIFGSYARNEADIFSDIDLTYKINHDKFFKDDGFAKLNKITEIKQDLERTFKRKVDLIPINVTNKIIKEQIQKEQIAI